MPQNDKQLLEALNGTTLTDSTKQRLWDMRGDPAGMQTELSRMDRWIPPESAGRIKNYLLMAGPVPGTEKTGLPQAGRPPEASALPGARAFAQSEPEPGGFEGFRQTFKDVFLGTPEDPTSIAQFTEGLSYKNIGKDISQLGDPERWKQAVSNVLTAKPLMKLEELAEPGTPARGALEMASEFTTPLSAMTLSAFPKAISMTAQAAARIPIVGGRVAPLVAPAVGVGFTAIMAQEVDEANSEGQRLREEGRHEEADELLGRYWMSIFLGMGAAFGAATGVVGAIRGAPSAPTAAPGAPRPVSGRAQPPTTATTPRALPAAMAEPISTAPQVGAATGPAPRGLPPATPAVTPGRQLPRGAVRMPAQAGEAPMTVIPPSGKPAIKLPESAKVARGTSKTITLEPSPADMALPGEGRPVAYGKTQLVKVGDRKALTSFAVVRNRDLVTSHYSGNYQPNPNFPSAWQARDRASRVSAMQIKETKSRYDPEQVAESYLASTGAPIVTRDFVVLSGHNRTISLREAFTESHPAGQTYKQWLLSQWDRFGLDKRSLEIAKKEPDAQLVRILQPSGVDPADIARDANVSDVAVMTPTEVALQDSTRIPTRTIGELKTDVKGDPLMAAGNRDFVRSFVNALVPASERGAVMTKGGELSAAGLQRVRNALFAKAYGDTTALESMAETVGDTNKMMTQALTLTAPRMVKTQAAIASGDLYDLPIHQDVGKLAPLVADLRRRGLRVGDYLKQESLFPGDELGSDQKFLMQTLDRLSDKPAQLRKFLEGYNKALADAGSPKQKVLIGGQPAPTKMGLLRKVAPEAAPAPIPTEAKVRNNLRPSNPAEAASAGEIVLQADAIYKPPRGGRRNGILYVNDAGMEVIRQLGGHQPALGTNMTMPVARKLESKLKKFIEEDAIHSYSPDEIQRMDLLRRQLSQAIDDNASLIVVSAQGRPMSEVKSVVREERIHAAQDQVQPIDYLELLDHPLAQKAQRKLVETGYPSDADVLGDEIGAKLFAGEPGWKDLALNEAEVEILAARYIELLKQAVGPEGLNAFDSVAPRMKGLLDANREVSTRNVGSPGSAELAGSRKPPEVSSSLLEGRTPGFLEGVPQAAQPNRRIRDLFGPTEPEGAILDSQNIRYALKRNANEKNCAIDPEIEKSLTTRIPKPNHLVRSRDWFGRAFVYEWSVRGHPELQNDLRLFKDAGLDATRRSVTEIIKVVAPLYKVEYDRFRRITILDNWRATQESGKQIPGGHAPATVQAELNKQLEGAGDKVIQAFERHRELVKAVGQDLAARGKISEEAANSPYFPHHVIQYAENLQDFEWMPKRLRVPIRKYGQRRGSELPIETDYIDAMHKHLAKMFLDNAVDDFIGQTATKYNELGRLSMKERVGMFGKSLQPRHGQIVTMPDGRMMVGWQPEPGRFFYETNTISDTQLNRALAMDTSVGDAFEKGVFKQALAVGGPRPTYLLEPAIAQRLNRFRDPKPDLPLLDTVTLANSVWKRSVIITAGLPHQVTNLTGDLMNLYVANAKAMRRLPAAMRMVTPNLQETRAGQALPAPLRDLLPGELPEMLRLIKDEAYRQRITNSATFLGGEVQGQAMTPERARQLGHLMGWKGSSWNPLTWLHWYESVSNAREAIPRLAHFYENVENIRAGRQVKSLVSTKELQPIAAAGKAAREDLIDYGKTTPAFDLMIRGLLFPFATFFVYNAVNWAEKARKNPKELFLKVGIPMAAMWAWNNLGEHAEVEERLHPSLRERTHLVTGWKSKEGKDIVIAFETPADLAAKVFGLHRFGEHVDNLIDGRMTPEQFGAEMAGDMVKGPSDQAYELLNPGIKVAFDLARNQDSFSGAPIVPNKPEFIQRGQYTDVGKERARQYAMSQLIAPYGAYQRASRTTEPGSSWIKWAVGGPLDVERAFGIRESSPHAFGLQQAYKKMGEVSVERGNTLSRIYRAYMAHMVTGDGDGFAEAMGQINESVDPAYRISAKEWRSRAESLSTRVELINEKLRNTTNHQKRLDLLNQKRHLQDRQYRESRKRLPKRLRFSVPPVPQAATP